MVTISSIDARFTQAQISNSSTSISESAANLSSGSKLNANVADLSVGTVLRSRVTTLQTATVNAGQAISLLSTAKGALETIGDLLLQQKSLAVKAADDSLTSNERGFLDQEFQSITDEIDRIASNTNFNGKALLDGSISGSSSIVTTTDESTENYSLIGVSQFGLRGTIDSGDLSTTTGTTGAFEAITADLVGATRAETTLIISTVGSTAGTGTITVEGATVNFTVTASGAVATATSLANALNDSTDADIRRFVYVDNGDGSITVRGADIGTGTAAYTTDINDISFQITTTQGISAATFGGANALTGSRDLGDASDGNTTAGADRAVATGSRTFDANLQGSLSNFTVTAAADGDRVTATFTVDVNGETYTSQAVYLSGSGINGADSAGTNAYLKAAQAIVFSRSDGPVDAGGDLTDNAFALYVGSSAVTIDTTSLSTAQTDLQTFVDGIETQLADAAIYQDRTSGFTTVSSTDPDIAAAEGTFLDGIESYDYVNNTAGDITFRSDGFGDSGEYGSVGSFTFDRDTGILTTTVDGVTYAADLSSTTDTRATTGYGYMSAGTAYSTSTGLFTVTNGIIVMASLDDTSDNAEIIINLATNVDTYTASVTVNSDDAETEFAEAFSTTFGASANDSLSFQVGVSSTDTIGISLDSSLTTSIYEDDDEVVRTLNVLTVDDASTASDVLDNAINTNISLIATVDAAITSFNSAIDNNLASIQNADAARSALLDTDFSEESTSFAEATVRQDAAVSVLAQLNQRIQNILQLLQ